MSKKIKMYMSLLLAIVMVCGSSLPLYAGTEAAEGEAVRLATFNIAANEKPDMDVMAEFVKSYDIDVMGVQEVDKYTTRNNYDMLGALAQKAEFPYEFYGKAIAYQNGEYGIGTVSKYEFLETDVVSLESSTIKEARVYQRSLIEIGEKQVAVYNTHITHESMEARTVQLKQLKEAVDQDPVEYKVIMGDFNCDQSYSEFYMFMDNYDIANGKDGIWYDTFNEIDSTMVVYAVDNIITTRNLEVQNIEMIETAPEGQKAISDHNLFYIDCKFLEEEKVSFDLLKLLLIDAAEINELDYTVKSFSLLEDAVNAAKAIMEQKDAKQEDVNRIAQTITDALQGLQPATRNRALNALVEVSGMENNDARFSGEKAIDGDLTTRWSGAKVDEQYLQLDLQEVYLIHEIVIDFDGESPEYKVMISSDGSNWKDVLEVNDGSPNGASIIKTISFSEPEEARYIRYEQYKMFRSNNGNQYSSSIKELEVYGTTKNQALNKQVEASGTENNAANLQPEGAVDGNMNTRWSAAKEDYQWFIVDLEGIFEVEQIDIYFHAASSQYSLFTSIDGKNWDEIHTVTQGADGYEGLVSIRLDNPEEARYIKYEQYKMWTHSNNSKYGSTFYEFEVYGPKVGDVIIDYNSAADVLRVLEEPVIKDGKLVLPESPSDKYEISLFGCDNQQVIDINSLIITEPLEKMTVKVLYHVENITDSEDYADSETDIDVVVPGKFSAEESDNEKPNVIPGLREWKGGTGEFVLTDSSRIVYNITELKNTANMLQNYFTDMLGRSVDVVQGTPAAGDIYLILDESQMYAALGAEGYTIDIGDVTTITSGTDTGLLYGGISITQIMYQSEGKDTLPKGQVRDYPKYKVRAGMIDVGRMYIPLEYLEEMSVYMAWFKMNEVHVHINDYWANSGYSGFRVESKEFEKINSEDGLYLQDDYIAYQKNMKNYGIDVITEIDTPYHAEQFRPYAPMRRTGYMEIHDQGTYDFVEALLDEFLDGDDRIIQSGKFHIGTDEYDSSNDKDREGMRAYTDHFINYVNDKGYETRLWGSLGGGTATSGFKGDTPVSNEAVMNLWAPYWADVQEMYQAGYDIINTCGGWLYIVPGENASYPDRIDLAHRYDYFDVNNFSPNRNPGKGTAIMPVAHPQTVGAQFCIWNDMTSFKGGYSEFDVFDRMQDLVMLVSEKTWYGEKTDGQDANQFQRRVNEVKNHVAEVNPGRYVETDGDVIASYDFYTATGNIVADESGNQYDALITDMAVRKMSGGIALDGKGYLSLPMDSIGFPYTVALELYLDELPDEGEKISLFSGADGELYIETIGGKSKVGYQRGEPGLGLDYEFRFEQEYEIPVEEWFKMVLSANKATAPTAKNDLIQVNGNIVDTSLYIDGEFIGYAHQITAKLDKSSSVGGGYRSNSFVLPVEEIMKGVKGGIRRLDIYNSHMLELEVKDEFYDIASWTNIALKKPAEATSSYPGVGRTPDKAVDGSHQTAHRWSSKRLGVRTNSSHTDDEYDINIEQWLKIDLKDTYFVDKVIINWEGGYAKKYEIQVSNNGVDFTTVRAVTGTGGGVFTFDGLGDVEARYVRILCTEANNNAYGYNIIEVEVFESMKNDLLRTINKAMAALQPYEESGKIGTKPGDLHEEYYAKVKAKIAECISLAEDGISNEEVLIEAKSAIKVLINAIKANVIGDDGDAEITLEDLQELYDAAGLLEEEDYTAGSWALFKKEYDRAGKILQAGEASQDEITHAYRMLDLTMRLLVEQQESYYRDILKIMLDEAEEAIQSGEVSKAVQDVQDSFYKAYNEAKIVYESGTTEKEEVMDAAEKLLKELHRLGFKKGNKERLQELVDMLEAINLDDYEDGQEKIDFEEALYRANIVLEDNSAMEGEIQEAYDALIKAAFALKEKEDKVNKDVLDELIAIADGYKMEDFVYDEAKHKAFEEALEHAKAISSKSDASQSQVDEAAEALALAMSRLRYKADKKYLKAAIGEAEALDLGLYTSASVKVLQGVLEKAQGMLGDESLSSDEQELVDAMAAEVLAAIQGLVRLNPETEDTDEQTGGETGGESDKETESESNVVGETDPKDEETKDTNSRGLGAKDDKNSGASGKNSAKTGDTAPVMVIVIMLLASVGLVLGMSRRRRDK